MFHLELDSCYGLLLLMWILIDRWSLIDKCIYAVSNQIKSVLYFQMKIELYNIYTYTSNVCNSNGKGESRSVLLINHFPPVSK